jgi:hypothetical protein
MRHRLASAIMERMKMAIFLGWGVMSDLLMGIGK